MKNKKFESMNKYVFFVTVPNLDEADNLAELLVENKIAACVNIITKIKSIYIWKDKIEKDEESLLIIKTAQINAEKLISFIEKHHSYETPECVGFKIQKGSQNYLDWIQNVIE